MLLLAAGLAASAGAADAPVLAAGKSLTVLDLADPFVRLVITAPANSPVDLSPLLKMKAGDSVRSIPTRLQVNPAARLTRNADGSISIGAGSPPAPGQVLNGGVLVFNAGRWAYHPDAGPVAAPRAATGAPLPQGTPVFSVGEVTVWKRGRSPEDARRDVQQCREFAERSALELGRPADRASMYNANVIDCLRSFGYEMQAGPLKPG